MSAYQSHLLPHSSEAQFLHCLPKLGTSVAALPAQEDHPDSGRNCYMKLFQLETLTSPDSLGRAVPVGVSSEQELLVVQSAGQAQGMPETDTMCADRLEHQQAV